MGCRVVFSGYAAEASGKRPRDPNEWIDSMEDEDEFRNREGEMEGNGEEFVAATPQERLVGK